MMLGTYEVEQIVLNMKMITRISLKKMFGFTAMNVRTFVEVTDIAKVVRKKSVLDFTDENMWSAVMAAKNEKKNLSHDSDDVGVRLY